MGARRIAAIALTGTLVAGGTGAAIAAVTKDRGEKAEQAVLDDAAKRLDITPERLRDALAAAQDAQIDRAVEDGHLTQKQADAIKAARKRSGRVLGPRGGPGPHGGRGKILRRGGGAALRRGLLADVAKALGTTPAKLVESLRSGTSLAALAKSNGKSLAEVRGAVKDAIKTRLDEAVEDEQLTRKQADAMLERVDEKLKALESGRPLRMGRHGRRHMPPAQIRPGALAPGRGAPELAPPGATHS